MTHAPVPRALWLLAALSLGGLASTCAVVNAGELEFFACDEGQCQEGWLCCAGRCWEGTVCPPPEPCDGGVLCAGSCVDLGSSVTHCGACGNACGAGELCANRYCVASQCAGGQCSGSQACVDDTCITRSCVGTLCSDSEICVGGTCLTRACRGTLCPVGQTCAATGCVDAECREMTCPGPCAKGRCDVEKGCASGALNPGEADVDCGGPSCAGCAAGRTCATSDDCASGTCAAPDAGARDGGLLADGGQPDAGQQDAGPVDGGPTRCAPRTLDALELTYRAVLFRAPDTRALELYGDVAAQGREGMKTIAASLFASNEFQQLRQQRPPRQVLRNLYLVLLNRELDDLGEALYLPVLFIDGHADVFAALTASASFAAANPTIP